MKKTLFAWTLVFLTSLAFAQSKKNFEGTILFSFEVSGGGQEMEMAKAFMPTGYVFKIKGENSRMSIQGGMMAAMMGDVVVNAAKDQVYMVNDANKSAMLMPKEEGKAADEAGKYDVQKGADKRSIAGFSCEHYVVKSKEGELLAEYWVTDEIAIKAPKGKSSASSPIGQSGSYGISGFPLRVQMSQMGMLITMEAKEVKKEKLANSLFEVPKDYTLSDFNPAMFQMGGDE
ncbi:MAG: hypothetical protein C0424_03490 [Sphingobacteriaceae bacterium]|nr:hypothetical protein [Sphingobacteriaceae bacterium]